MTDEALSGWLVRISPLGESGRRDWLCVTTHYGYRGYIPAVSVRQLPRHDYDRMIPARENPCFRRINRAVADVLSEPKVSAPIVATLYRDSIVRTLETADCRTAVGWSLIRCADGRAGYIHSAYLSPRTDDDRYFLRGNLLWQKGLKEISDVDRFRRRLVDCAMSYRGTQYRWGGKSSAGVDCSGFVFLCYMENGVLIYRDAQLRQGYPVHEISRAALKPGDLIYWERHVAMHLGGNRYIHAAGSAPKPCVTVGSLNPEEEGYRADLADTVKAYGSVF